MDGSLTRPATGKDLVVLFHAGLLPRESFERAMGDLGIQRHWWQWGNLLLLCLGGALLLAGTVFFIAYNWMTMPKALKLGGLQILILACAVAGWRLGLHRLVARALLFAACVLVGVYLAVFGQIYQTGADAYELFRAWALLILLWTVSSREPLHWLLLLAVTNLAIGLHWDQVVGLDWGTHYSIWLLLALLQFLGLAGLELGRELRHFWLDQVWPRWVLVPVLLFQLCAPGSIIIFDDNYERPYAWLVLLSLVAAILGGYRYYRHVGRDLFALTCVGAATAWIVFVFALKLLEEFHEDCWVWLFLGVLAIVLLGGLVRWVRSLSIAMQIEAESRG